MEIRLVDFGWLKKLRIESDEWNFIYIGPTEGVSSVI